MSHIQEISDGDSTYCNLLDLHWAAITGDTSDVFKTRPKTQQRLQNELLQIGTYSSRTDRSVYTMVSNEAISELERKYLLWLASSVKFYMAKVTVGQRAEIQSLVLLHGPHEIEKKIPMSLATHTKEIKLFAQIVRLSEWLREQHEGLAELIEKYSNYTAEDFIRYYNNYRKGVSA